MECIGKRQFYRSFKVSFLLNLVKLTFLINCKGIIPRQTNKFLYRILFTRMKKTKKSISLDFIKQTWMAIIFSSGCEILQKDWNQTILFLEMRSVTYFIYLFIASAIHFSCDVTSSRIGNMKENRLD